MYLNEGTKTKNSQKVNLLIKLEMFLFVNLYNIFKNYS